MVFENLKFKLYILNFANIFAIQKLPNFDPYISSRIILFHVLYNMHVNFIKIYFHVKNTYSLKYVYREKNCFKLDYEIKCFLKKK